MLDFVQNTAKIWGFQPQYLFVAGAALGMMLGALALMGVFNARKPVLRRLAAQSIPKGPSSVEAGLLRPANDDPTGLMKSLIPVDRQARTQVQRLLAEAGVTSRNGLRNYYLIRLGLGLLLPALLFALIALSRSGRLDLPDAVTSRLATFSMQQLAALLSLMVVVGFFGPAYWLKARVATRRQAISDAFPNVLDLLQISVESGLGLDAAMIRVANETEKSAPEISQEFTLAQREIQAGRSRDRALLDMAARTGVAQVNSFANVVLQSLQFGSSISDALAIYADEMRQAREMKAQEMANKLPVKMSAVMASLMLPTLLMLALGPVVIRYIRYTQG
jgi:tight adherence protein C